MGLDAQLIAIGPFSKAVLAELEYDERYYEGVAEGDTVITTVVVAPTSKTSIQLAEVFSVGAMELGKHHVNPEIANIDLLEDVFGPRDVERFLTLRSHRFEFYYLPNA